MTPLLPVATDLAERLSERLGERVHQVELPAPEAGGVPRVALGVTRGEVLRIVASASGGSSSSVEWIEAHDGVASLRAALVHPQESLSGLADRVAASVSGGMLDALRLNALDVAVGLVQGLSHALVVRGSQFRMALYGQWSRSALGSGTRVEIEGAESWEGLAWIAQDPSGVTLSLPSPEFGGARTQWQLSTPADLRAAFEAISDHVKRAIEGRAAWRARAFPIDLAGRGIVGFLEAAGVAGGALHLVVAARAGFPSDYPLATVFRKDALGEHACVGLVESADGVAISAGRSSFVARDAEELEALLPSLAAAVRAEQSRLTSDKLVPGAHYRVLRDLPGAVRGTLLRFDRRQHVAYDGFDIHHFTAVDEHRAVALYEIDRDVAAALSRLDEHLEKVLDGASDPR